MPNGYTSKIYDGQPVTPVDFLVNCARGMGYFMHMRDDDSGAELRRDRLDQTKYHREALVKAKADKEAWNLLNEEDKYARWSEYFTAAVIDHAKREADKIAMRARYLRMIAEVTAYKVEPLMESTKEFALKMLRESMEVDCPAKDYASDVFYQAQEYVEWCESQTRRFDWEINYHTEHLDRAKIRQEERERYLAAFEKSFGVEVV